MAAHVLYTAYGEAQVFDKLNGGWQGFAYNSGTYRSDASETTTFIGISPAITIGTFTINAIVEVLPFGLNQKSRKFFTDSTVATLNTAAA